MQKISLIALNARYTHTNPAVKYIKMYCEDEGYIINILEHSINSDIEILLNDIFKGGYCAAAFSVYIWNISNVKKIIKTLTERGFQGKIILGGPEASYNADVLMSELPQVDYIVKSFGEEGFRTLLRSGFNYPDPIVAVKNPTFDEIPFLYIDDDFDDYENKYVYYESSRGCPYKCTYCLSSAGGHEPDNRSTEKVLKEISWLIEKKPIVIKFIDRTFNHERQRSRIIWKHIIEGNSGKTKFHFEINPILLDDIDFELLSEAPAGLFQLEAGIQSLNPDTLKAVCRPGDPVLAIKNICVLAGMKNIHLHTDLIAGLPFEDLVSFRTGFNKVYSAGPDHLQAGFLKILPGTRLKEDIAKFGIIYEKDAPYEILSSRWMSADDISLLKRVSLVVDRYHNSGRYKCTLKNLLHYFADPFSLFQNIADYSAAEKEGIKQKDSVYMLAEYIHDKHAGQSRYLFDCLRWDRADSGIRGGDPFLIKNSRNSESKKKLWIKLNSEKGKASEMKALKNGILFTPETEIFKHKYMNGMEAAVFVKKGLPPLLYCLD